MNLPKLPFLEKKEKSEYFLSLVLRDEKASAVVFKEVGGRVNVVGEHNQLFRVSLEDASEEELLDVIDKAVSLAEKTLPEGVESQKTIFGLKESWTAEGKIKPHYLSKLKKISDELQFKPVGFLVITEAIIHYLEKEEGAPVSAIVAEIGKKSVTVSLTKAGKLLETKSTEIDGSIPVTVDTLLKHFTTAEVLPSRVIIFDNGSEKLQQEFTAHKWSRELGFLHIPQITNLPSNFDAKAVLSGAATQMGFEVLEASLIRAEKADIAEDIQPLEIESEEDKTLAEAASEFGFSSEDVADKPKTAIDDSLTAGVTAVGAATVGAKKAVESDNLDLSEQFKEIPEEVKLKTADKSPLGVNATAMSASMKGFAGKLKLGKMFKGSGGKKKLIILIIPLALLIVLIGFYAFGRSATVTLGVSGQEKESSETVTLSEDSPTSASDKTINVKFITSNQDGKVTTAATGKKETGDKAKGTVTIFNTADSGKTITAGTIITSSNNLKFVIDKSVTVASGSADPTSLKAGQVDVTVTAEKFGTNYNLPSGTKFTLEGTSEIAAKNDSAFSGGTKKDIKVVSQKDLAKLEKDLQEQLEAAAKADIAKQASSDSTTSPNFTSIEFDKKSFSKKVDDEANEVSLTGVIVFEGVAYKKSDLIAFAKDKLSKDIPDGMIIDEDRLTGEATDIETDDGVTKAKVNIKAILVPDIDPEEIAKSIAGESVSSSTQKLQDIPEVERVNIKVFINLPLLPNRLPFSSGKIKVEVDKNG